MITTSIIFLGIFVPDDKGPQLEPDWSPHLLVRIILHYGNYNCCLDEKIRSLTCGDHHPTILASFSSYKQWKGHHHWQEPESGILSDLLKAFSLSIVVFCPFLSSIRDGLKGKNFLKVNEWEFFPISVNFVLEMTGYQLIFLRSSKLNNVKLLQIGVKMFFRDHHQYLRFMRIILYNYKGCVGCWCISWAHAKIHKTKYSLMAFLKSCKSVIKMFCVVEMKMVYMRKSHTPHDSIVFFKLPS